MEIETQMVTKGISLCLYVCTKILGTSLTSLVCMYIYMYARTYAGADIGCIRSVN